MAYGEELWGQGLVVPASVGPRIADAVGRIAVRPEVPIALVGGTGSGKSTLVNALLDAYVVPISTFRACTSTITEIAWSASGYHSATIEFVSREEWREELDLLEADLADADRLGDGQIGATRAAQDKLRAIYGEASADRFLASFDRADLVEPPVIRAAFDRGRHIIESEQLDWFRDQLGIYLAADHTCLELVRPSSRPLPPGRWREWPTCLGKPGLVGRQL